MKHSIEVKRKSTAGVLCPGENVSPIHLKWKQQPRKTAAWSSHLKRTENPGETSVYVRQGQQLCPLLKAIIAKKKKRRGKNKRNEKRKVRETTKRGDALSKTTEVGWEETAVDGSLITLKNLENWSTSGHSNREGDLTQITEPDLQLGLHHTHDPCCLNY